MAGINNNLGNFNLRNSLLKNNAKKAEVKDDAKQEKITAKSEESPVKSSKVKIGDINTNSLLANKGIKIAKPVGEKPPTRTLNSHHTFDSYGDLIAAINRGEVKPGDTATYSVRMLGNYSYIAQEVICDIVEEYGVVMPDNPTYY